MSPTIENAVVGNTERQEQQERNDSFLAESLPSDPGTQNICLSCE